jgi:putative ABC transport system permease protein
MDSESARRPDEVRVVASEQRPAESNADWAAFVRARLKLPGLTPERESRIVRELAAQLDDFYRDALARGSSAADAEAYAHDQIRDWDRMAQEVWLADRRHARSRFDRLIEPRLEQLTAFGDPPSNRRYRGGLLVLSNLLRDVRYALRQLIMTPGFSAVAILTLALGIGATTAIFSVVNGVLLRPLPYPDPESLVRVHEILQKFGRFSVAPASFLDWRQQNTVFEHIAAYNATGVTLQTVSGPERVQGALVSWDLFDLLQVAPGLGRAFRPEEDMPGKDTVIILSHGLWQRRFNGDSKVLGQSVTLNGMPVTVVGVMPAGFTFAGESEFWRPLALDPAKATRGGHFLGVIARLKAGVTIERAGAEMKTIAERLAVQHPDSSANESAEVIGLHANMVERIRPALLIILAAVGVLILIACANVANLLLVRASIRGKEIAIRTALGAGRLRLMLQMLAESVVLALAAGGIGVLIGYWAIRPIQTLGAGTIPRAGSIAIDGTVLAFALVVSVATGILFGLAPAWQASRATIGTVLKEGGRSSTASGGRWIRNGLLIMEVAMSVVLLVGASLLLRSFARLIHVDPGFRPEQVLAFRVALPNNGYPQDHLKIAFFDRLMERLENIPDVTAAGMIQTVPMRGDYLLSFKIEGRPPVGPNQEPSANHRVISPNYFKAMGIPVLRGRPFTPDDREKSPMVAVVDQTFVDRYFPDEDPIGKGIDIGNGTDGFYKIVGVVGSVRNDSLDSKPSPTMYVPYTQDVFSDMWIVVRAKGEPTQLSAAARQAVRDIDNALPAFAMTPLADVVSESIAQRRFSMLLIGIFAALALILAAVGLYGVVSYSVSQRTQEIGLRMAIGAQPRDVLRLVVGGGMKLAMIGAVIGIGGALALSSVMATMLFELTPLDLASYSGTALGLLAVAMVACYVPARRALRVDPIVALRAE